jgi:enamine deaminase RidA (YjgF/YER057c/UK114 family)
MNHLKSCLDTSRGGNIRAVGGMENGPTFGKAGLSPSRPVHGSEFSLTLKPRPGDGLLDLFGRLAIALKQREASLLKLMIYGSVEAEPPAREVMRELFGPAAIPVTWVEGAAPGSLPVAGMQAFALAGGEARRIMLGQRVVGSVFDGDGARYCLLAGLGPSQVASSPEDQTRQTFDQMEAALGRAGFALGDVVRTWFFLDDMLSWYDAFNRVRAETYSKRHFRSGALPASTGVGGRNPDGAALTAAAWAMQPSSASTRVEEVLSPRQCPAPAYGSLFSRAMELSSHQGRRILISGTASIDPDGRTVGTGEVRKQVALTMEVVEAMLHSRGFSIFDTTRATAYFKHTADMPALAEWCAERRLASLPVVPVRCDICRDDLLFEIELDGWKPR